MKYVELGKAKEKVSAIGLGSWQLGSKAWGYGRDFEKDIAIKIINAALDQGMNLIDTAELYAGGKSEEIIGEAIKERRDEVFIATKVFLHHMTTKGVVKAAQRSAERLGVKTIDLYQIHWPNPIIPLKGTIKALDKLVDEGKIRYIGVSNFSMKRLKSAQALTKYEIVSDQVGYSLAKLNPEKELLPYVQETGVKIIAYSPLAQGMLTGKYTYANRLQHKGWRRMNTLFSPGNLKRAEPLLSKLREIGEKYGKVSAQVALNWLISNASVIAIPGAKSVQQLESNLGATDFQLNNSEIEELRELAKNFHPSGLKAIPWKMGLQK